MKRHIVLAVACWALGSALAQGQAPDLIQKLASPSYRERETAMQALRENLTPVVIEQLEKALESPNLELARRTEILLADHLADKRERAYFSAVQHQKDLCGGKLPWASGDGEWHLAAAPGTSVSPNWTRYRNATEMHLLDLARARQPLKLEVDRLKIEELDWIELYGKSHSPPIKPTWEAAPK